MRSPRFSSILAVVSLTACGRFGFSPSDADVDGNDGAVMDDGGVLPEPGIYRSVGAGSITALAAGLSNPMTIASGVATFTSPLPDRIGVGDVIQYDASGDGAFDTLAFIHARWSSTSYLVATELGDMPPDLSTPDTDWSIFRAYTSLQDAADGTTSSAIGLPFDTWTGGADVVALGKPWHIACYGDAPDIARAQFMGWVTSNTDYLRVFTPTKPTEVGITQRHAGTWDSTKYYIESPPGTNDLVINVADASVRIDGLQVFVNTDGGGGDLPYGVNLSPVSPGREVYISNNLIRSNDTAAGATFTRGIKVTASAPRPIAYIWNNVIYDFGGTASARGIELTGPGTTAYIYNNTFSDVYPVIFGNNAADVIVARNNAAVACGGTCVGGGFGTWSGANNRGTGFDAKAIGAPLPTDVITDYFLADGDFRLAVAAAQVGELRDMGADLSADPDLAFDRDIQGDVRKSPWDIGADEQ